MGVGQGEKKGEGEKGRAKTSGKERDPPRAPKPCNRARDVEGKSRKKGNGFQKSGQQTWERRKGKLARSKEVHRNDEKGGSQKKGSTKSRKGGRRKGTAAKKKDPPVPP